MIKETQKFYVGEIVGVVNAQNQLVYAEVLPPEEDLENDRIAVKYSTGTTARPTRDRVAHLSC